jgi:hypothetical protein
MWYWPAAAGMLVPARASEAMVMIFEIRVVMG